MESKVTEHLNRQCLGSPMCEAQSVQDIVDAVIINQGCLMEGVVSDALRPVVEAVLRMVALGRDTFELHDVDDDM